MSGMGKSIIIKMKALYGEVQSQDNSKQKTDFFCLFGKNSMQMTWFIHFINTYWKFIIHYVHLRFLNCASFRNITMILRSFPKYIMFENSTLTVSCETFSENSVFSNPWHSSSGNSSIQEEEYSCKNLLRKKCISFWRKISPELKRDVRSVSSGNEIPDPGFGDA